MPLTEPYVRISRIRLFSKVSPIRGRGIITMIDLRFGQGFVFEHFIKLGYVVTLLLTPPVYPFVGKFNCLVIERL